MEELAIDPSIVADVVSEDVQLLKSTAPHLLVLRLLHRVMYLVKLENPVGLIDQQFGVAFIDSHRCHIDVVLRIDALFDPNVDLISHLLHEIEQLLGIAHH